MESKESITIIGSGNWGSAIAKIAGQNVRISPEFNQEVRMWVFEEEFEGRKLSEIINTEHVNKKYLPGIKIPENVVAIPSLEEAVNNATVLVFVVPHQYLKKICETIKPHLQPSVKVISLMKGITTNSDGPVLLSDIIRESLEVSVSVMMGANIANEVAREQFSESTIGYEVYSHGKMFQRLFDTDYFKVSIVEDVHGVELCGALKNVVALGAGFVDGLEMPGNTKAAVIRGGLVEMMRFAKTFYSHVKDQTFFESCGVADLFVSCYGGRNRKCAEAFVKTHKSFEELEKELLHGQKLPGPLTSQCVYHALVNKNLLPEFPLFEAIYEISFNGMDPSCIIKAMSKERRES